MEDNVIRGRFPDERITLSSTGEKGGIWPEPSAPIPIMYIRASDGTMQPIVTNKCAWCGQAVDPIGLELDQWFIYRIDGDSSNGRSLHHSACAGRPIPLQHNGPETPNKRKFRKFPKRGQ